VAEGALIIPSAIDLGQAPPGRSLAGGSTADGMLGWVRSDLLGIVATAKNFQEENSQGAQFCFGSNERKWTYVLGRKYSSFQGTIGLSDNSVSTAKIRFEILADGRPAYSKDLQVGQSAALNVPVRKVLHLELDTTLLTQDGGCGAATGEWADIHAVGP